MAYKILLFCFLICTSLLRVSAQSQVPIGGWKSHLPYTNIDHVEQSEEKIFLATEESLMIIDKLDGSRQFLSTLDGLSETYIVNMIYDDISQLLIVAYANSTFDIISEDQIIPITDIKDKTSIQGNKLINDLHVQDGRYLYLATGFGLVQFDLQSFDFGFTMDLTRSVDRVSGSGSDILIAMEEGVFTLDIADSNIPGFFAEWSKLTGGLPQDYSAMDVMALDGKMYIITQDDVYFSEDKMHFESVFAHGFDDFENILIEPAHDGWLLTIRSKDPQRGKSKLYHFDSTNGQIDFMDDCYRNIEDVLITQEGNVYAAEIWDKYFYREGFDGACQEILVDAPFSREVSHIDIVDGKVYVASGGVRDNFGDDFSRDGFYVLSDGEWTNVNQRVYPFMADEDIIQIFRIAGSPDGEHVYAGSFWAGLMQYNVNTEDIELYNEDNSPLSFLIGDKRVRISGLEFDDAGNLWVGNYGAITPLAALTPEGDWYTYNWTGGDDKVTNIVIDDLGYIWAVISGNQGAVVVYDTNGTLDLLGDDRYRVISKNNSVIPSNTVYSAVVDNSGAVWVGTSEGAVVFECGASVFEEDNCQGNRRKITVDGILANLLESEEVLAISVDGADRKWFGTRRGVFVLSPDGEELVTNYNTDNSPLFDNTIQAMAYDPQSGEMFVGTNRGLQSIRTESTSATDFHASEVYAFPNPVRPDYQGPIAIKGLPNNAEVRITDLEGRLVHKSRSLGGQAIWDGRNLNGSDVAGGVYLVFSSSTALFSDVSSEVTKILVVK